MLAEILFIRNIVGVLFNKYQYCFSPDQFAGSSPLKYHDKYHMMKSYEKPH